jgi:hypothetical protein
MNKERPKAKVGIGSRETEIRQNRNLWKEFKFPYEVKMIGRYTSSNPPQAAKGVEVLSSGQPRKYSEKGKNKPDR